MISKHIVRASALLAGMALAACGGQQNEGDIKAGFGSAEMNLSIPNGHTVNTINLDLVCPPSVDQDHVLNVTDPDGPGPKTGQVVAAFGGLPPGACTATMTAETLAGYKCQGQQAFTIVEGQRVDVVVTLLCQGTNTSTGGGAKIGADFVVRECGTDRIKKVFAIPSNVVDGESTTVNVELNAGAAVGTPKYVWATKNDATNTANATGTAACNDATSCVVTCNGLGANETVDPTRYDGLPHSGVYVTVRVEDDECFDTEEVWVDCIKLSECGNGVKEGSEQCDGTLGVGANETCSATCTLLRCGDGVKNQASEQCDGADGVGANQGCSATCQLVEGPSCGDGVKNQASEECDGTDGVLANQTCGADCKVVVACGNSKIEAGELCDDGNTQSGDGCSATCQTEQTVSACEQCLTANTELNAFRTENCPAGSVCAAALSCLLDNPVECWNISAASCFCGTGATDVESCETPTFTPVGPCASQLLAGAGGAGTTNAQVLERFFDPEYQTGLAGLITNAASQDEPAGCKAACF